MKKTFILALVATMLVVATPLTTAHAEGTDSATQEQTQTEGTTEGQTDEKDPNTDVDGDKDQTEESDAPVISVKSDKFLVEQGTEFDLASALELKITDKTDKDLTDKVKIPEVNTSSVGILNFKIEASNSLGKKSELTVTINIVGFVETKSFEKFEDVKSVDLNTVVTGNMKGLQLSLGEVSEENSTFEVVVTDGVNTLKKTVKALDKEGNSFGKTDAQTGDAQQQQQQANGNGNANNLPKTGAVEMGSLAIPGLIALSSVGYIVSRKRK